MIKRSFQLYIIYIYKKRKEEEGEMRIYNNIIYKGPKGRGVVIVVISCNTKHKDQCSARKKILCVPCITSIILSF